MSFIGKEDFEGFNFDEFLSFKKIITPVIIKIVYLLGVLGIVIYSLYTMFRPSGSFLGFLINFAVGILMLIFANISWRITCELIMVIFNILGELKKLNHK